MTAYNQQEQSQIHCSACAAAATHGLSGKSIEAGHEARNSDKVRSVKRRGLIGRWLDRLTKANEREFGGNGPSCCH